LALAYFKRNHLMKHPLFSPAKYSRILVTSCLGFVGFLATPASALDVGVLNTIPIYRLVNGQDHLMSVNPREGTNIGYVFEQQSFNLFNADNRFPLAPVYRCRNFGDHFMSTSANCEGVQGEGQMGYLLTTQLAGTIPVYRFYKVATGYHLITIYEQEGLANGFQREGILGYVPSSLASHQTMPAIDYFGKALPGSPAILTENGTPKRLSVGDAVLNLYDFAHPENNPPLLRNFGAVKRECSKINPQHTACFSTFPYETTLQEETICGYPTAPAAIVSCQAGRCVSEVYNAACGTAFPSLSGSTVYNTRPANFNIAGAIDGSDEFSNQGFNSKFDFTSNLNTAAAIMRQGRIPIISVGGMLFDNVGLMRPNADQILNTAIAKFPQLFASNTVIEVIDEPFLNAQANTLPARIAAIQSVTRMLRAKIPTAQLGVVVAPTWDRDNNIIPSTEAILGGMQWAATDLYASTLEDTVRPVSMANDFSKYMKDNHPTMGRWLILQGFAPQNSKRPQLWGSVEKAQFRDFITRMANTSVNYTGVLAWGWNSVVEIDDAYAGKNFPDDIKKLYVDWAAR
jgi:hypothetical protein